MILWLIQSIINKSFKKFIVKRQFEIQSSTVQIRAKPNLIDTNCLEVADILTNLSHTIDILSNQLKGGCPRESTNKKKKFISITKAAFTNEVAVKCNKEKQQTQCRIKKSRFNDIVEEIYALRNIDSTITVLKAMID